MDTHPEDLAQALDAARRASGLSYAAVVRELYDRLGPYAISTVEGVRNYHRPGTFPARPDLVQICALADIYKVKLEDIDPAGAEVLRRLSDSLGRGAWSALPV